jgi:putative peptide maturation system protein
MQLDDFNALEVNGEEVSLAEVLRVAKCASQLQFIRIAIDAALVRQAVEKRGIEATDEELQEEADIFRAERELFDAEATEAWLAGSHLSYSDWEVWLEERVVTRKLREALFGDQIEQHFAVNRLTFDEAAVSQIIVKDEDLAQELRAQIVDDGADFHALAREHSIDEATRPASGYAGTVRRTELEAAVEAAVFGARPGTILGPFKDERGWLLIKVDGVRRATLDEATTEVIREQLFNEWLTEQRVKARLAVPLLQPEEDEDEETEDDESEEDASDEDESDEDESNETED